MDIELLISPVEARPVVCDKTYDICNDRNERKKRARIEMFVGLEEELVARYKNNVAINSITVRIRSLRIHA